MNKNSNPMLTEAPCRRNRWREELSQDNIIHGKIKDFPEEEEAILKPQGIKSILIIPIWVHEEWFGFIGFDDVLHERDWDKQDILLLRTFAQMLGNYFERKAAEKQLFSRKEQFELAVKGSNDGIWDWDLESGSLFLSARWKAMLGYEENELANIFDTFLTLLHEDDKERAQGYIDEYLKGNHEKYDAEFRLRHKDGTYRWIRARGEALFDSNGKAYRMVGSNTDITEKREAEQLLREREVQFRTIFHHSPQPMALTELKSGKIIEVNDVFCEKLNIRKESILDKTTTELNFYSPSDREKFTNELVQKGAVKGLEMDFNIFDGSRLTAEMYATFITVNSQQYILTMFNDITDKKRSEEELIASKEAAEIANKAKSEFLANMSHEIRTPLNGVIGFSQLLLETPLSHLQQQYSENINTSAQSLLEIINDILDFSKIEAGKLELDFVKTDMWELLEQSIDIIKFPAAKKKLEILLDIDPEMPRFAVADPVRLKQILANLLGNAVKFTEAGEVELKVRFKPLEGGRGAFRFTVRDTGIGMSKGQQKKLFKAFSQADSSTTREYGGSGLGLVISENIAEKMGTTLDLESSPGKGSVFSFTIETEFERGEKIVPGKIEDIKECLVIDDNENNRNILKHMLDAWGIGFTGCEDGLKALRLIEEKGKFDIIICDYHMPYLNGFETIRMIREKLGLSREDQPIALLHSSSDDERVHKECRELHVRWQLTKPIKRKDLLRLFRDLASGPGRTNSSDTRPVSQNIPSQNTAAFTVLIAEDNITNMLLAKSIINTTHCINPVKHINCYSHRFREDTNMKLKAYRCSHCNEEQIINAEKNTPECCGESMEQIPLDNCSKPYNPESARLYESDDACDDGVN